MRTATKPLSSLLEAVAPPPGRAKAADFPPSNAQVNGIEKDAEKLRRDKQAGGMKASK